MKYFLLSISLFLSIITLHAQPAKGSKAPEIALPGVNGNIVKLSSLAGKMVVVDFWASWCRPCRESNREMRNLYKKYKDKGLEVYGISIDDSEGAWKRAISQDEITWLQVIDKQAAHGNELTQTWGIRYIPSTFLIDRQGNVVAVNASVSELNKKLKKLL